MSKPSPEAIAVDEAKQKIRDAIHVLGINYVRWYVNERARDAIAEEEPKQEESKP